MPRLTRYRSSVKRLCVPIMRRIRGLVSTQHLLPTTQATTPSYNQSTSNPTSKPPSLLQRTALQSTFVCPICQTIVSLTFNSTLIPSPAHSTVAHITHTFVTCISCLSHVISVVLCCSLCYSTMIHCDTEQL